jgi:hypothetical protein
MFEVPIASLQRQRPRAASECGGNKFGTIALSLSIAGTAAQGGGTVTDDGNAPDTERGVCCNATGSPTVIGPHTARRSQSPIAKQPSAIS